MIDPGLIIRRHRRCTLALAAGVLSLTACQTVERPPISTMPKVELARFMGDWYVVANIPTFTERDAYNAVESYRLDSDGSIATTFTFRKGGFEGEEKRYEPRGFVVDTRSNAVWGMQFVWPIKADYRILYVDQAYTQAIIAREKRDYVWLMARKPEIPPADYQRLVALIAKEGYDVTKMRLVPQRWERASDATQR